VGLLLAHLTLRALNGTAGIALARMENVAVDSSVLMLGLGLSVLCGLGFGSYPAFSASRVDLNSTLREGGRGQTGGAGSRFAQRLLIAGEFALTLTLLAAAGLMIRSLIQAERVPLGFRPDHASIFRVVLPDAFSKAQRATFHGQLRESLRALPGVTDSGAISNLFSARNAEATIQVAGQAPAAMAVGDEAMSEGLLSTIGSRLRAGRDFDARDNADAPRVAIVNERFVRSVLPAGQSAVGARIRFLDERYQGPDQWVTIVGVVEDIRRDGLEREPFPVVFSPFRQNPSRGADVVIRSANDPQSIMLDVRRLVTAQQPTTPVYRVSTLENRLEAASQPRRLQTALLTFFAAAALLLASSGAYALLHYLVSQRTREIGLRVAIGASAVQVVTYVLRDVLRLIAAGLLVGVAAALLLARAMQSMLFGVTAADPLAFAGAVIVLSTVALVAGLAPAIRAARLNPIDALRD
jgi:predicted permease